jgi:hypothetical protein
METTLEARHEALLNVMKSIIEDMEYGKLDGADGEEQIYRLLCESVQADEKAEIIARSEVWVTCAPDAYDGFGTTEIMVMPGEFKQQRVYRQVAIRPEHSQWQRDRYSSGLYACISPEKFAEWCELGIA